jgi:hypothetical protein
MAALGDTYRRWAAGLCACCGGELCEWIDGTPEQAVAEGVQFCGRCMANCHDEPAVILVILDAIVQRSDAPIEKHLGSLG